METAELFISGRRDRFAALAQRLAISNTFNERSPIRLLEGFRAPTIADKKRGTQSNDNYATPGWSKWGFTFRPEIVVPSWKHLPTMLKLVGW